MTEELRRLEYARKNAKDYKTVPKTGLVLYDSTLKARQSNAVESKLLTNKLLVIRKEESGVKCDHEKSLYKIRKLRASILRPVSRGIVGSEKLVGRDGVIDAATDGGPTKKQSSRYLQPLSSSTAYREKVVNRRPKSTLQLKQALSYEPVVKPPPARGASSRTLGRKTANVD
ncbi:hypothetical protein LSH36_55g00048 [Paralvinella palmiformis]|uniref:Uncharacterized protein n=1 Tax=Paralvinella palmiformis TaxID=53620 RepID=A0AAD9NDY4_9ANNE|nr:hypothetical protein LSH36_55g00048 [Paralvinella palmiformis]